MTRPVTVVTPTIPGRKEMLDRAIFSVQAGNVIPEGGMQVAVDQDKLGAAATRNRALQQVTTEWVAFLDDDDEFLAHHLEVLLDYAEMWDLDVVYPGCEVVTPDGLVLPHEEHNEEWGRFGKRFSIDLLRQRSYIPVTSLARTDLAQEALFGAPEGSIYDDWGFYLRCHELGAQIQHVPVRTWIWHHHGANTSGQPDRW